MNSRRFSFYAALLMLLALLHSTALYAQTPASSVPTQKPALPTQTLTPTVQTQTRNGSPVKITTEAQTRERLLQTVHLNLGSTTLPAVMQALSEQTGLQIEAAGYLREHRLQLCLNNVSALNALETLGDLNDWKWQVTEPGHVLLGRPLPKTPLTVMDVSVALQAALPRDMRRFIGSDGDLKAPMYMPGANLTRSEMEAQQRQPRHESGYDFVANMKRGQRLFTLLTPQIVDTPTLLCSRLTPPQQQALLTLLTLTALNPILSDQHNLLTGLVRPHQRDPEKIDVSVQNGNIMLIGTYTDEIVNGKRHGQFSCSVYKIDAPATNNSKWLRFGGPPP